MLRDEDLDPNAPQPGDTYGDVVLAVMIFATGTMLGLAIGLAAGLALGVDPCSTCSIP